MVDAFTKWIQNKFVFSYKTLNTIFVQITGQLELEAKSLD